MNDSKPNSPSHSKAAMSIDTGKDARSVGVRLAMGSGYRGNGYLEYEGCLAAHTGVYWVLNNLSRCGRGLKARHYISLIFESVKNWSNNKKTSFNLIPHTTLEKEIHNTQIEICFNFP